LFCGQSKHFFEKITYKVHFGSQFSEFSKKKSRV
jgi:hypothetical protein